jgi:uncharacterized protein involved in exopolysaccharide biosynthesis/Mrp family chromosome partitioning ATPase
MLSTAPPVLPSYHLSEHQLDPNEPDSIDIDAIIRFIRKRRRLCLLWIFAALFAGAAFTILSPRYYTAFAVLLLEDPAARPAARPGGGAVPVDPAYADSQVEVLQSDEVLGRIVDQERLTEIEGFGKAEGGLIAPISRFASQVKEFLKAQGALPSFISRYASHASPGPAAAESTPGRATVMLLAKHALSVRRLGVSNAVEIGFTSRNPVRSAAVANAIAESYIDNQLELKRKAVEEAASRLQESLAEIRDKAFGTDPPAQDSSPATPETAEQALSRSRELQNSADAYRALYNSLLQRRYTEFVDQFTLPAARVITPAESPTEPSWPRAILVFAIAIAGGGAGGIGHALLREATDHSLRTVEDVQRSTSLERVTGIAKLKERTWNSRKLRENALQPAYVNTSPKFYATMGKLAARLQGGQNRQSGLIIGVVASTANAGASTVAAHLARVIAESGQKTLLVDANWRKPSTDQALREPNPGRKLAWGLAVINLEPESLMVLLLRPTAPISELSASLSIAATLQQLRAEYECIVVDFHSAEQTADFEANLTAINEAVVVVEARRTSSESLNGFLRLIPGNKVASVVLNKV